MSEVAANTPGDPHNLFRVWGFIAGQRLPPDSQIEAGVPGGISLTRDFPDSLLRCEPPSSILPSLTDPNWGFISGSSRITIVASELAFNIEVWSENEVRASETVQNELLPAHVAALSAIAGETLFGTVIATHRVTDDPEELVSWYSESPLAHTSPAWPPGDMIPLDDVRDLPALLWSAQHDETARRAARTMHVASLHTFSRTRESADLQAILMSFHLVLEGISRQGEKYTPREDTRAESEAAVQKLRDELELSTGHERDLKAVRKAAIRLKELHARGDRGIIRSAGESMGLAPAVIADARALNELRGRKLAHVSGLGARSTELEQWLPRAAQCAQAYLSGYLRWIAGRGVAYPAEGE